MIDKIKKRWKYYTDSYFYTAIQPQKAIEFHGRKYMPSQHITMDEYRKYVRPYLHPINLSDLYTNSERTFIHLPESEYPEGYSACILRRQSHVPPEPYFYFVWLMNKEQFEDIEKKLGHKVDHIEYENSVF